MNGRTEFICRSALLLAVAVTAGSQIARAQATAPAYDPTKTFAPLTLPDPVNDYRADNGAPGPDYWQNSADYELHATIDTAAKQLSATEVVTYGNNGQPLPSLWMNVEQNTYPTRIPEPAPPEAAPPATHGGIRFRFRGNRNGWP